MKEGYYKDSEAKFIDMIVEVPGININYEADVWCKCSLQNPNGKLTIKARRPPLNQKVDYNSDSFKSFGGEGDYSVPVKYISRKNVQLELKSNLNQKQKKVFQTGETIEDHSKSVVEFGYPLSV
jgi:hypothetical protein